MIVNVVWNNGMFVNLFGFGSVFDSWCVMMKLSELLCSCVRFVVVSVLLMFSVVLGRLCVKVVNVCGRIVNVMVGLIVIDIELVVLSCNCLILLCVCWIFLMISCV